MRAHNWVVVGALLENPGKPAWFLPISGRLYFRKSQLPARSGFTGPKEEFRTKCELIVELFREQARVLEGRHLAVFDGGFALRSVVRPLVAPEDESPRIEFLTRLRHDARLYAPLPAAAPGEPEVGPAAAAAPPGGLLGGAVARGAGVPLRPLAEGPLEGGGVSLARLGARRAGQGGGRQGRGLQEAVHAGQLGRGADRAADGGAVLPRGSARRTGSGT